MPRKASMTRLSPRSNNSVCVGTIPVKIVWHFGLELQPIFGDRMKKSEPPCMQHLPGIIANGFPINFISKYGVSDGLEMHPDLMSASRE